MSVAGFEPHPIANLFPMIAGPELDDLAADIRENGLLEPVVLHEAQILDGRNRYAACERAGVSPRYVEWHGEGGTPLRFVLSHNLHRRHLSVGQRAAIAAEVLPMFEEEARKRQVEGARDGGRASAPGRPAEKGVGQKTQSFPRKSSGRGPVLRARDEAAAMMNVSPASVERAKRVRESDPEAFEKLKAGGVTVNGALRDAGLRDSKYREAGEVPTIATGRDVQRAEAHKRRLETALSGISGSCRGIRDINVALAVAAMTPDEVEVWANMAGECARELRDLRKNLNGSNGHE